MSALLGGLSLSLVWSLVGGQAPAVPPADVPVAPLPMLAVLPLTPAAPGKADLVAQGELLAAAVEEAAQASASVNVVTQGAWTEVTADMDLPPGKPLADAAVRTLGRLSGATHVVVGSVAQGKAGALAGKVRVLNVTTGEWKDAGAFSGTPADALGALLKGVFGTLGLAPPTAPFLPLDARAQSGTRRCAAFAAVALERAALKGRGTPLPPEVEQACTDAAGDPQNGWGVASALAVRALSGLPGAEAALREHVKTHPNERLTVMSAARLRFDAGARDDALALLSALSAARPHDPDVLRMVGELHLEAGRAEAARDAFARAAQQAPQSAYHRYRLSYATYKAGQSVDALEHARAALELAGKDAPFYQLNLAERLLDQDALDEAIALLTSSVERAPRRLTTRVRLGYAHILKKQPDAALKVLSGAEKMTPTDREVARGIPELLTVDLARAHALKGNAREAMKYLLLARQQGMLESMDLRGADFEPIKNDTEFLKLRGN